MREHTSPSTLHSDHSHQQGVEPIWRGLSRLASNNDRDKHKKHPSYRPSRVSSAGETGIQAMQPGPQCAGNDGNGSSHEGTPQANRWSLCPTGGCFFHQRHRANQMEPHVLHRPGLEKHGHAGSSHTKQRRLLILLYNSVLLPRSTATYLPVNSCV